MTTSGVKLVLFNLDGAIGARMYWQQIPKGARLMGLLDPVTLTWAEAGPTSALPDVAWDQFLDQVHELAHYGAFGVTAGAIAARGATVRGLCIGSHSAGTGHIDLDSLGALADVDTIEVTTRIYGLVADALRAAALSGAASTLPGLIDAARRRVEAEERAAAWRQADDIRWTAFWKALDDGASAPAAWSSTEHLAPEPARL